MTDLCRCPQCQVAGYTLESFLAGQAARFKQHPDDSHREIWRKWTRKKGAEYMAELARLIKGAG